jgi:hypothetical protein
VIGPGLAKTRGLPFVLARAAILLRAPDARWRELFERADIVSEGGVRVETAGRIWYGSTSLILHLGAGDLAGETWGHGPCVAPGDVLAHDPSFLATLVRRNAHVRLRAVRTAHREACSRAPCALGRFTCEIRVKPDARGVRIDVDVQAPLIETRVHSKSAP